MTPRLMVAAASAGVLVAAAAGLYWKGRLEGAARERPKVEAARAQAAVAALEIRGERESAQRVEVVVRQREAAVRSVTRITHEALTSEDAHAALDPARADRLRAHDRELCDAAPDLAGCTETGNAGGGASAVRAPPTAGAADAS